MIRNGVTEKKHCCPHESAHQVQQPGLWRTLQPNTAQYGFFYFYIFQNYFLQKYIFCFIIYNFAPLPPGCGAAGPLPGGRDLNINKIYF